MAARVRVSERDLRALLSVASGDRGDAPAGGVPPSLLADLAGLIRCDIVTLAGLDSDQKVTWFAQGFPPETSYDQENVFWQHYWTHESCCYPDRTGDLRTVTKRSDFFSARQLLATGLYADYLRPIGSTHGIMACLPARPGPVSGPGRTLRLVMHRGPGRDFSERDRALLTLLRPHLHQARLDAESRRLGVPQLTRRHWELLRLVAAGHTNAQIARRLGLSEGTVRIHLENIYGRLQVSSRTAAVTRAFGDHSAG
jgi:DNA-binding CsgD family transcriptional regulator